MYSDDHVIYGTGFAFSIWLIFPQIGTLGFVVTLLSTFLIDVDHYFYYIFYKRDLNPINACVWFDKKVKDYLATPVSERPAKEQGVFIFHSLEFLSVIFILGFFVPYVHFVLIGFVFHVILDMCFEIYHKVNFKRKLFFCWYFLEELRK